MLQVVLAHHKIDKAELASTQFKALSSTLRLGVGAKRRRFNRFVQPLAPQR
jgi:hypothetical protein